MPVYEFYCPGCHTLLNFYSRRVDTARQPACPHCGGTELLRQVSLFAIAKGRPEGAYDEGLPAGMDEDKMMRTLESMAGQMEGLDENDPKGAALLMRRLFDAAGMKLGDGMAEAIRRLEAGEAPDQVEAEMGDLLEAEAPFAGGAGRPSLSSLKELRRGLVPPRRDETWYPF